MRTAMLRRKSERDGMPAYPFAAWGLTVPIEIVAETPYFYVAKVLPHYNPDAYKQHTSEPYMITVDKGDPAMEVKFK